MRCLPRSIRNTFQSGVVVLACLALTSCGTTCVAGIFANGNGIVLVKNSTPPPACPFSMGVGMMNVAAGKSQICEICTASSRAQHICVTLKSIQLHSVFPDSPEQIPNGSNLRLNSVVNLAKSTCSSIRPRKFSFKAHPYPQARTVNCSFEFLPDTPSDPDALPAENSCGNNRRNCMLMADGRVEELHFTGNSESPELLLPLQYNGSSGLAVVPGATVDLRFTLQPQQVSAVSLSEGWQIHYVLVGSASVSR